MQGAGRRLTGNVLFDPTLKPRILLKLEELLQQELVRMTSDYVVFFASPSLIDSCV